MDAKQWQEKANEERKRLLDALGHVTAGGVVGDIQHIGATSVPELATGTAVELALAVTPFPLEPEQLAALGYALVTSSGNPSGGDEQIAQHTSGTFRLFISEQGSDEWTKHLLLRDYLRHNAEARRRVAERRMAESDTGIERGENALTAELLDMAQQWWPQHVGFAPVEFVMQELAKYHSPWYISSGWAIDLYLGRVTRVHHDVDVVVAREDQLRLREVLSERGWRFVTPLQGQLQPWPAHMRLELPRHQFHAHREEEFIDFLLTDLRGGVWRYRRNPIVIRHLEQATRQTDAGIPYLAPELVLLFKSKNTGSRARAQDQADYARVRPHLEPEARAWLRWALIATDPTHPWIAQLG
jgi:GrpB-like predicted nucleotidyltransferase (UPF0157 family)